VVGLALGAELFPDAELATRPGAYSARALGMGRTVLTAEFGAPALLGNPALLASPADHLRLDATADVCRIKETRAYPIHDAFDGILAYNNYVLNDHLYSKLDGGVVYNMPYGKLPVIALGVGTYSVYRFDYRYHEEVRYRNAVGGILDLPMANNRLDISGDLRSFSFGLAVRERFPVTVGVSVSMLAGDWTYEEGTYWVSEDSTNIVTRTEYSLDGIPSEIVVGIAGELSERVSLGARVLFPTSDFDFDTETRAEPEGAAMFSSGTVCLRYPSRFGLGVQYRPRSDFMPRILFEGEVVTYSQTRDDWDDVFEIRAGVEQQVVRGIPVRAGFFYAKAPDNSERSLATFSTGIGLRHKRLYADFGMELGKVNYTYPDLFPNTRFGGARVDVDRVETGLWRGVVSVHYEL
ncbi:MAG: hypothetical protein V1784_11000, partial [bacterium]